MNISNESNNSPDFIGIGAMRCGTTWLADKLRKHPGIYVPSNFKELHYFDQFYHKGNEWYESNFKGRSKNQIVGEFTPKYLREDKICKLIYENYPDVKLIVSIRNPVDRAFSHYNFLKKHSSISDNFYESLFDENYEILKAGLYGQQILNYLNYFDRKKIHIIFFDDIKESPDRVVREMYKFLGVSTEFKPESLEKIINKKVTVRSKTVAKLIRKTKQYFRPRIGTRKFLRFIGLYHAFKVIQFLNRNRVSQPGDHIKELEKDYLKNYYKEDIILLDELLKGRVTDWF